MDRRGKDLVPALSAWVSDNLECEPGLSTAELDRAESTFDVRFPPLWRAVLGQVHPVHQQRGSHRTDCPDWRIRSRARTQALVDAPANGLLFDVEHNRFWWKAWGPPPAEPARRLEVARVRLSEVPRLVPLWGHTFVADTDDSPVFSIVQADLYVCALDLPGRIHTATGEGSVGLDDYPIGRVPFWSELHAYSQLGHLGGRFGDLAVGGL